MGKYYEPSIVKEKGTKLKYRGKVQPPINHRLVMILDRQVREIAVDVTDPGEFDHFLQQYSDGWWLTYDLYDFEVQHDT